MFDAKSGVMTTQTQEPAMTQPTAETISNPSGAPDPRPAFAHALDQTGRLIHALTPDQLDLPTPCDDFTVRQLLGHLIAVERRVVHIAHGGSPFDVTSQIDEVPGDDWAAAWDESRTPLDAALAEEGVLDRVFDHPAGKFPGRQAIFAYVSEMAVHGWDLAMAVGRRDELDETLAAGAFGPVKQFLPAQPRGERVPFAAVVEVPEDARAYDQLVGWMGRNPRWSAA